MLFSDRLRKLSRHEHCQYRSSVANASRDHHQCSEPRKCQTASAVVRVGSEIPVLPKGVLARVGRVASRDNAVESTMSEWSARCIHTEKDLPMLSWWAHFTDVPGCGIGQRGNERAEACTTLLRRSYAALSHLRGGRPWAVNRWSQLLYQNSE